MLSVSLKFALVLNAKINMKGKEIKVIISKLCKAVFTVSIPIMFTKVSNPTITANNPIKTPVRIRYINARNSASVFLSALSKSL